MSLAKSILCTISVFLVFFIGLCVVITIPIAFILGVILIFIDIKLAGTLFLIGIFCLAVLGTINYYISEA